MPEYEDEEEGAKLYLCQQDCYDGVRDFRRGERYAVDPANPFYQRYFKIPEKDRKKPAAGADKK